MNKPTLIIMIGLPGSNASLLAQDLADIYDAKIISLKNEGEVVRGARRYLENGINVILDGPNVYRVYRRHIINRLKNCYDDLIAVEVKAMPDECIAREPLLEESILAAYKQYEVAGYDEGFTEIKITDSEGTGLW